MILLAVLMAALATVGPPQEPPPKVSGAKTAPPPAWASTSTSRWLAYSSYCWATTCVDFLPPAGRSDLPTLRAARGATVVFHLGFQPRTLKVSLLRGTERTTTALRPARIATWRVRGSGLVVLEARAAAGSASYALRIRP